MSTLRENIIEALKDELVWKTEEDMADILLTMIRKAQREAWDEAVQYADDEGCLLYHEVKGIKAHNPYKESK